MATARAAAVGGVERLLSPADGLRGWAYRALSPWLARWMREREQRVALLGALAVAVALTAALVAPLWLLAVSPIVLGVPHVLSDLRYLWVRPGFHRQRAVWLLVIPLLIAGTATAQVSWGLGAAALGMFAIAGSHRRRLLGALVLLPLLGVTIAWPGYSNLAFAHLHNLIAVGLWWAVWPRKERWHHVVLALLVAASLALMAGLLDPAIAALTPALGGPSTGQPFAYYALSLAPGASPTVAARLVVLYTFGQSIHYAIWLRLVPEDARQRRAPRPFVASYRALRDELGPVVLVLATLGALAVAIWAVSDLAAARDGYLRAAIGHGHLELAAAAMLFVRGRRPPRS